MRDLYLMYLRKSRADNASESVAETLARHESQLQEYAKREFGYTIPEDYIYREVVSGETIKDRPFMQLVLQQLETKQFKGVLVVEPQRLSRGDMLDCGTIVHAFRYTETLVITPVKTYNLTDEYDRKFFEMELSRGNDYLEYVKKILQRGRIASVKEGQFIASDPPYGYNKISYKEENGKIFHTLEPHPQEAPIVKYIYELYLQGWGYQRIANELNNLNIPSKRNAFWSAYPLKAILSNPVYIGKICWNQRKTQIDYKNGELIKSRPMSNKEDWLIIDGKHPAIISNETYLAAQERMGKNPRIHANMEMSNPLSGLLFCQCGKAMVQRKHLRNGKTLVLRYVCSQRTICETQSALVAPVLESVKRILECYIQDFEIQLKNSQSNNTNQIKSNMLEAIQKELAELDVQEEKQFDFLENGTYTVEIFTLRRNRLLKRREELKNKQNEILNIKSTSVNYKERIASYREAINVLESNDLSAAEKNLLLKKCIKKITYCAPKGDGRKNRSLEKHFSLDLEPLI